MGRNVQRATLVCATVVLSAVGALSASAGEPAPVEAPQPAPNPEPQREIRIEYATVPMLRNAGLALGCSQLAESGLDLATRPLLSGVLERRGVWGIAARAAWTLSVDMPVRSWGSVLNHELGHALRRPSDVRSYTLTLGAPHWPLLFPSGGSLTWSGPRHYSAWERMASAAGGWEADALVLEKDRTRIYSSDRMHYADAMAYSVLKLKTIVYLLDGTSDKILASDNPADRLSDPLIYAEELAEIDEGPQFGPAAVSRRAHELRRGAYWNLADYTLWASTVSWLKGRVVDGHRYSPTPWITLGQVGLAPSAAFTLTPYGSETSVLTGWRVGERSGFAHVRWSNVIDGDRVIGGGGSLRLGLGRVPIERVALDVWRDRSGTLGGRLELSGVWRRSVTDRLGLSWSAGVKSRGPLVGFSTAAQGYASLGVSLKIN